MNIEINSDNLYYLLNANICQDNSICLLKLKDTKVTHARIFKSDDYRKEAAQEK